MYYSQTFFQKDIYQINENDLLIFFANSPEESSILELKSGGTLQIEKVYSEVCALHNTQGGLIIIGSPKPRKDQGREFFDGELTRSPFKDKDWVYQKISSNISPVPTGLKIHDVKMSDDEYVQIIDIPQSIHPPHQCSNGIYYLRFETQSRFAPHGLIEAMFNKRQEPSVDANISKFNFTIYEPTQIEFKISNISQIPMIGVNGLIKFYNIEMCAVSSTISGHFDPLFQAVEPLNDLVCFSGDILRTDSVVVNGLSSLHRYYVTVGRLPFIVHLLVWSSNMNLQSFGFIISSLGNKAIKFEINEDIFQDAAKTIENLLYVEKDEKILFGLNSLLEKVRKKNF